MKIFFTITFLKMNSSIGPTVVLERLIDMINLSKATGPDAKPVRLLKSISVMGPQ